MTPDSPKGPERATHTWTERSTVAGAMEDAETGIPANCANWQIASVVLHDEVERLTTEVAELNEQIELQHKVNQGWMQYGMRVKAQRRKYADELAEAIGYDQQRWLPIEAMIDLTAERFRAERLKREITSGVMRGLAGKTSDFRRALAFADAHVPQWERIISEHKAEVSRLREQLAAQQPVWTPADPTDESARLAEALRFVGVVDPDDDCMSVFDTTGEGIKHWVPVESIALRLLEHTAGVSSSEVEAPQPPKMAQHKVRVTKLLGSGQSVAVCPGCRAGMTGADQEAEDWRDQHEADTLVPQVKSPNHQANQHDDEGRPTGCVRIDLVSQWNKGDKALHKTHPDDEGEECQVVAVAGDTVLVEADPFPFGNPRRWSADVSELAPLPASEPSCEELVPDGPEDASLCGQDVVPGSDRCADHGGRPSGSERLAPRPVETFDCKQDCEAVAPECFCVGTEPHRLCCHEDAAQAARSEATPEDPPSQSSGFKVGDEVRWCWSGDNADGTWFKARLTEEHPANYPKGWAGEITDCGTAYTAEHMGEVPLGFHVYMDVPSMTLAPAPSPSLRKEGEDSD